MVQERLERERERRGKSVEDMAYKGGGCGVDFGFLIICFPAQMRSCYRESLGVGPTCNLFYSDTAQHDLCSRRLPDIFQSHPSLQP